MRGSAYPERVKVRLTAGEFPARHTQSLPDADRAAIAAGRPRRRCRSSLRADGLHLQVAMSDWRLGALSSGGPRFHVITKLPKRILNMARVAYPGCYSGLQLAASYATGGGARGMHMRRAPSDSPEAIGSTRPQPTQTPTEKPSRFCSVLFGLSAFLLALAVLRWLASLFPGLAQFLGG